MIDLQIQLFGHFAVRLDGRPIPRRLWKRRWVQLLGLLALADGHTLGRAAAARALGLEDTTDGLKALRTELANVRSVLAGAAAGLADGPAQGAARGAEGGAAHAPSGREMVQLVGESLRLNPRVFSITVDALRWEARCQSLVDRVARRGASRLEPGELEQGELETLGELVWAYDRFAPEFDELIPCEARQHALDQLFARALALYLPAVSDPFAARALFRQRRALLRELLPGPSFRRLQRVVAGRPAGGVALPDPPGAPPRTEHAPRPAAHPSDEATLAPFVGRERELERLDRALQDYRLVEIMGLGGMGKTRLAVEGVRRNAHRFSGGAYLVRLASVSEAASLPLAVASALGVTRPATENDWVGAIVARLRGKRALLLLDNCEHLLEPVGRLTARLLAELPRLTILATTQRAFAADEAFTLPLGPLSYPRRPEDAATWRDFDAMLLARERLAVVGSGGQLSVGDLEALAGICAAVEGTPLFIEQALGLARTMSLPQLLGELRAFGIRAAPPDARKPARQRSPAAVFEYALARLDDRARALLRRMAVFAGGFTLDAARTLCPDIPPEELPPLLAELLADHLLIPAPRDQLLVAGAAAESGGPAFEARYAMPEPLRQHCLQLARAAGAQEELVLAFACWVERFARTREAEFIGGEEEQIRAFAMTREEQANIRNALQWVTAHSDHREIGYGIAGALVQFWRTQGLNAEGAQWCWRLLPRDLPDESCADVALGKALLGAGLLGHIAGIRTQRSLPCLQAAEAIFARAEAWRDLAYTSYRIGVLYEHRGEYETAMEYYRRAIALGEEHGDDYATGIGWSALGTSYTRQALYREAREALWRARFHAERADSRRLLVTIVHELAKVEADRRDLSGTIETLLECVAAYRRLGDRPNVTSARMDMVELMLAAGDVEEALKYVGEDASDLDFNQAPHSAYYWQHFRGVCLLFLGRLAEAERCLQESYAFARELRFADGEARALVRLAQVAVARGDSVGAQECVEGAHAFFANAPRHHYVTVYFLASAQVSDAGGEFASAARALGRIEAAEGAITPNWTAADLAERHALARRLRQALGDEPFTAECKAGAQEWAVRLSATAPSPAIQPHTPPRPDTTRDLRLTAREEQLVALVAKGLWYSEIAAQIGTSPNTVRHQLSALRAKVGAADREALVRWCAARIGVPTSD